MLSIYLSHFGQNFFAILQFCQYQPNKIVLIQLLRFLTDSYHVISYNIYIPELKKYHNLMFISIEFNLCLININYY